MEGQLRKVTLPGEMFEQAGRWWWRVKLPGEDRVKARSLNSPVACDPQIAEQVAVEMWQEAIVREGTRQVIFDCTRKVEEFKARIFERLRQLTEIIDSATAKAQAEARARAEIESKLNAMIQAAGLKPGDPQQWIPAPPPSLWTSPVNPQTTFPHPAVAEGAPAQSAFGLCEGCGATDVPAADLERIDSGQWLCPDCLHTLRVDALRDELETLRPPSRKNTNSRNSTRGGSNKRI